MSWVNSESKGKAIQKLRGALIDEIGATRLYDELSEEIPECKEILQEIKNDEVNHQGRLIEMMTGTVLFLTGSLMNSFNAGLEQKD